MSAVRGWFSVVSALKQHELKAYRRAKVWLYLLTASAPGRGNSAGSCDCFNPGKLHSTFDVKVFECALDLI